jgi:AcrR family transcriptional regulator
MLFSEMAEKRKYELKERARKQAETRRRITEAAVELHEELGPAETPVTEIARRAGVQRLTVYKHFPDEAALIAACSSHWSASHPLPDPEPWRAIGDPAARTRAALGGLYAFYSDNERMLGHVARDAQTMPAVRAAVDRDLVPYVDAVTELLTAGWRVRGKRRERVAAQLGLVLPFDGWRLMGGKNSDPGATADLAADLVRAAAA